MKRKKRETVRQVMARGIRTETDLTDLRAAIDADSNAGRITKAVGETLTRAANMWEQAYKLDKPRKATLKREAAV